MTDLSLTILAEKPEDAAAIERLHERTFGPGRYARTAYRIREQIGHQLDLSFTARIGTLLLGPLTIEPPFRDKGIGLALMRRALDEAKAKGHRLVVLVGDESYYKRVGFNRIPGGRVTMPGPVDPARLLVAELDDGAFNDVTGAVRPDWEKETQ
jgi:predicted N-acetyltransferase YhbS